MLATSQETDIELNWYNEGKSGRLEKIYVAGTRITIFCDSSNGTPWSFLTKPFRRAAFNSIHNLANTVIKATIKVIARSLEVCDSGLSKLSSYMREMLTCKNHTTCNCTTWNIHKTIKKVLLHSHKYHFKANRRRRKILSYLYRPQDGQKQFRWKIRKQKM